MPSLSHKQRNPASGYQRLRLLWHVGAVVAPIGDLSFGVLVQNYLAVPRAWGESRMLYTITDRGRDRARKEAANGWQCCSR
jgi:hypothetical protein